MLTGAAAVLGEGTLTAAAWGTLTGGAGAGGALAAGADWEAAAAWNTGVEWAAGCDPLAEFWETAPLAALEAAWAAVLLAAVTAEPTGLVAGAADPAGGFAVLGAGPAAAAAEGFAAPAAGAVSEPVTDAVATAPFGRDTGLLAVPPGVELKDASATAVPGSAGSCPATAGRANTTERIRASMKAAARPPQA